MTTLERLKKDNGNLRGKNTLLTKHNKKLLGLQEKDRRERVTLEERHQKELAKLRGEYAILQDQLNTLQTSFDLLSIHGVRAMAKDLEHYYNLAVDN